MCRSATFYSISHIHQMRLHVLNEMRTAVFAGIRRHALTSKYTGKQMPCFLCCWATLTLQIA